MKLNRKYTTVKNMEEYKKAKLILGYYSITDHPNLPCNEQKALSFFLQNKDMIYIFINIQGELGCISNYASTFDRFEFISFDNLINKY